MRPRGLAASAEAHHDDGARRLFRPAPAAMSTGIGSDSQRPFAIVIVGGLISRLVFSIFLAPVLYALVARDNDVLKVLRRTEATRRAPGARRRRRSSPRRPPTPRASCCRLGRRRRRTRRAAGLEQMRRAGKRPLAAARSSPVSSGAGLDEPAVVERDAPVQPVRVGHRAGHHEHVADRALLDVSPSSSRQRTRSRWWFPSSATTSVRVRTRSPDCLRCAGRDNATCSPPGRPARGCGRARSLWARNTAA